MNTFPPGQEQVKDIRSITSIQHCAGSSPSTIKEEKKEGHADWKVRNKWHDKVLATSRETRPICKNQLYGYISAMNH